jgi:hypothetical protein
MRNILLTVLVASVLFATGCSTIQFKDDVQAILNAAIPSEFVGDAEVEHWNPLVDFNLTFINLHKVDGIWQWTSLSYHRKGRYSTGAIKLTPR